MTPTEYRARRIRLGYTQQDLAAILGVSRETIVRREKSRRDVPRQAEIAILSLPKKEAKP